MSQMNSHGPGSNKPIPNAPKAPPLPAAKPGQKPVAAKPGGPVQLKPVAPKAPAHKPGFDQSSFSEVTKNAKKPGKKG